MSAPKERLSPVFDEAQKFLDALDPKGLFTFQTFGEGEHKKDGWLRCVLHGTFADHKDELANLNAQGAGVFFMVNHGNGILLDGNKTCRTNENVIAIRALFVDLDGAPLDPVQGAAVPPDIIVESSVGRYHAYWLAPGCPNTDFTRRQKQLAAKFDGDPAVIDLARVMRVPGFVHQKDRPFITQIVRIKS